MARANPHPSYDVTSNTYILKRQGLKDKGWQTEIGDVTETNRFQPRFLVRRWLDDANFGIDLPQNFLGGGDNVSHDGEAIVWTRSNVTARFFDWSNDPDDIEGNGSYEWEIIFSNPLPTNSITLPIRRKNIVLHYQPPLTQDEIDAGFEQPERAVGSYAVYHATKNGKRPGDPIDYQTGKIGHLYRPLVRDANGSTTWATFNDDAETTGTLTVTIDPTWLASAVYPITIDPTFGYTSIGASNATLSTTIAYSPKSGSYTFTSGTSDVLTLIQCYCKRNTGTGDLTLGVYDVSGGVASSKLTSAVVASPSGTASWQPTAALDVALASTTEYTTAGACHTAASWNGYYDTVGSSSSRDSTITGGVLNSTWTNSATTSVLISMYSTYVTRKSVTTAASALLEAAASAITVTTQASARLIKRLTATVSGSARLVTRTALTVGASALIVAQPTVTTDASAHLLATSTVTAQASALAVTQPTVTTSASAHLVTQPTVTTGASAYLVARPSVTTDASAHLLKTSELTTGASALLQNVLAVTTQASAHLLSTTDVAVGSSALAVDRITVTADASALAVTRATLTSGASAHLLSTTDLTVGASAYLRMAYRLVPDADGATLQLTSTNSTHYTEINSGDTTYDTGTHVSLSATNGTGKFSRSDQFTYRDVPASEQKGTITKITAHIIGKALDSGDPNEEHIFWLTLSCTGFSSTSPEIDPYHISGNETDNTYEVERKSSSPGGFFSYADVNEMQGRYYMTVLAPAIGTGQVLIYDTYLDIERAGDLTSSIPRLNSPGNKSIWALEVGASANLQPATTTKTVTTSASAHLIDETTRIWKGVVDGVHQYFKLADAALVSMFGDGTITDTNLSQLVTWLASVEFEATARTPWDYSKSKFPRVHVFTRSAETRQDETQISIGVDATAELTVWTLDADPNTSASQNIAICGALAAFVQQTYKAPGTDWMDTHANWGEPTVRVQASQFVTAGDMAGLCRGVVEVRWSHRDWA